MPTQSSSDILHPFWWCDSCTQSSSANNSYAKPIAPCSVMTQYHRLFDALSDIRKLVMLLLLLLLLPLLLLLLLLCCWYRTCSRSWRLQTGRVRQLHQ